MKFFAQFFALFVVFMVVVSQVVGSPAPEPKWKVFKKLERVGQNVRDGIIKAGPAVGVLSSAKALGK